jgi:transcriptional regulator with XRE-family HTH domain
MMMGTVIDKQPLAALVRQAHDTGLSYREMADRARRAGHEISHTQLSDYAQGKVMKAPSERMLRAIAAAIDAAYGEVRAAMFEQFYGYTPRELRNRRGSRLTAVVPENLDPSDEAELVRMIEAWLSARQRDGQ